VKLAQVPADGQRKLKVPTQLGLAHRPAGQQEQQSALAVALQPLDQLG